MAMTAEHRNTSSKMYVFIAPAIGNVGGGQLYLNAKSSWLEETGWDVKILYIEKAPIRLEHLKKYEDGWSEALQFRFASYSNKERNAIIRKWIQGHTATSTLLIESYSYETALWGEFIARHAHGKHICYLINEQHLSLTRSMRDFLLFKLNQHLLFGITPSNIPSILPEAKNYNTFLSAVGCSSAKAPDIDDPRISNIPGIGYNILSIGRLEKPYFLPLCEEIVKFAQFISEPINFIIIGDTSDIVVKEKINDIFSCADNVNLIMWGYTFPIPRQLFEKSDVFVGCAGSANIAYKERVPSITIDSNDFKAIGILGETTSNRLYRNNTEPPIEISDLLMSIYQEKNERRENRKSLEPIQEQIDFSTHKEIIDLKFDGLYYPVEKVKNPIWFDLLYKSIKFIGGRQTLMKAKQLKQRIWPSK